MVLLLLLYLSKTKGQEASAKHEQLSQQHIPSVQLDRPDAVGACRGPEGIYAATTSIHCWIHIQIPLHLHLHLLFLSILILIIIHFHIRFPLTLPVHNHNHMHVHLHLHIYIMSASSSSYSSPYSCPSSSPYLFRASIIL